MIHLERLLPISIVVSYFPRFLEKRNDGTTQQQDICKWRQWSCTNLSNNWICWSIELQRPEFLNDICSFSRHTRLSNSDNVAQSQQSWNMSAIFTMFSTLRHKSGFLFRDISTNLRHKNHFVCCSILFKRNVLLNHVCCFVILLQCRLQTLIKSRASQFP